MAEYRRDVLVVEGSRTVHIAGPWEHVEQRAEFDPGEATVDGGPFEAIGTMSRDWHSGARSDADRP